MKRMTARRAAIFFLLSCGVLFQDASAANPATWPTPPEVWRGYDPDAGDFKEEIVAEETKDGLHFRETYISAYVLGEEVRVYCKYAMKADASTAPGLMDVHGWMSSPRVDLNYVRDGWAVMAHDYCGKIGDRTHYTLAHVVECAL